MSRKNDILATEKIIESLHVVIEKLNEQAIFSDLIFEIAYSSDLSKIFAAIIHTGMALTDSDCGFIAMVEKSEKFLNVKAEFGLKKLPKVNRRFEIEKIGKKGVIGRTVQEKKTQNVGNVKYDSDYLEYFPGIMSELATAIMYKNKLVGIINLESVKSNNYDKFAEEIIKRLSDIAVVAINRSSQIEEILQAKNFIGLLYKIDKSIIEHKNLKYTLELILNEGLKLIDADIGFIQIVNEKTEHLEIEVYTEEYPIDTKKMRYKIGKDGITGYVAQTLKSVIVNDVTEKNIKLNGGSVEYISFFKDIGSEMTVPLVVENKLIGIFDANSFEKGFFNEEKKEIIEKLALQAAISIESHRNREYIAQNELLETIESTTSAIIHWLRNKLLSFGQSLKRLENKINKEKRLGIENKTAMKKDILMLYNIYNQMDSLCEETRSYHKTELHPINLLDYFENKKENFGFLSDVKVCIKPSDKELPELNLQLHNFDIVIDNILINAVEAMEGKSEKIIIIHYESKNNKKVRISISDTGKGIPPENVKKIFNPLYTDKIKGTGLGLAVTYNILKNIGGFINVTSDGHSGTTFAIDVPLGNGL